ncbi:MAG: PAQR family membrane homeostasis protein TrhA [Jatrophihabitantaceae bacterium]
MHEEPAMDGVTAPALKAAQRYDSGRGIYYDKPAWRGWLHLLWFEAALVCGTLLLVGADGATRITASAIYVGTAVGLFGTSALYHRGNWSESVSRRLQRLDHAMIFFLIAGTATPPFLVAAPGWFGRGCAIALWGLTLLATGLHLAWMNAPEKLVGGVFIGLGVVAGLAVPIVWIHTGVAAATLLLSGGILYIVGATSYHRRRPDPRPAVFGYHEVFHAYVCAAAACQAVAIGLIVL